MASGGSQAAGQRKSKKGRIYDPHDQAAIMGWCGVSNIAQAPRIWAMWLATANINTHRTDLQRGINTWAAATKRQIEEPALGGPAEGTNVGNPVPQKTTKIGKFRLPSHLDKRGENVGFR